MRISVKIKPSSKVASVQKIGEREFSVQVKSPPKEGKANAELIKVLGEYFGVPKTRVMIVLGLSGKKKVVDIAR